MENTFIQGNAKHRTVQCQWMALLTGDSLSYQSIRRQSIRRQNGKNKVEINNKQVFKSLGLDKSYVKGRSQKSVTLHLSCDIREIEWLPWFHETKICGSSGQ